MRRRLAITMGKRGGVGERLLNWNGIGLVQEVDHADNEWRRTPAETEYAGIPDAASHGCPTPGQAHWDQSPAAIPEKNSQVEQVQCHRGAIVEAVPECISAPIPVPARPSIRAMGAASNHRCPCRSERQGLSRALIQLIEGQAP